LAVSDAEVAGLRRLSGGDFTVAIATIALILHILSAVVWVGGMFFALVVLRPASGPLDPAGAARAMATRVRPGILSLGLRGDRAAAGVRLRDGV
jgi:hypothetical protein